MRQNPNSNLTGAEFKSNAMIIGGHNPLPLNEVQFSSKSPSPARGGHCPTPKPRRCWVDQKGSWRHMRVREALLANIVHIDVYIHTHTYIHTYIRTYIRTYVRTYTHAHLLTLWVGRAKPLIVEFDACNFRSASCMIWFAVQPSTASIFDANLTYVPR